jgi:c-di-GMP-binding flagellar brake protein YcgR
MYSRFSEEIIWRVPADVQITVQTNSDKFIARTEDISGGGVSLYCDAHLILNSDEPCQCSLSLYYRNGSVHTVPFTGKLVRVKKTLGKKFQWISIKIEQITHIEQQKIIRFCFEKQIDMKK